jgi:oligoendopeptidase F
MQNELATTSWDNTNIYLNLNDPKIEVDISKIEKGIMEIEEHKKFFNHLISEMEHGRFSECFSNIELIRNVCKLELDLSIILYTLGTYGHTSMSVDTQNAKAKTLNNKVNALSVKFSKAYKAIYISLLRAPSDFIQEFLKDPRVEEMSFILNYERKQNDFLLPVSEEVLLTGFSLDGLTAWGKLYTDISGAIKVTIDGEEMGLAKANNFLSKPNREMREKAYRAINQSWKQNEISACAILNSINGWRNENFHVRSHKKNLDFLDYTCHSTRISRKTLDTLIDTTFEKRKLGHDILKVMASEYSTSKLGPWDMLAPMPVEQNTQATSVTFPKAIEIIVEAFGELNGEMASFAKMMFEKNWIDSTPSSNRAQGAYCTGFASVNEPRVFITFDGSMKNVVTLAHEIGHAYHNWVMRDIKLSETHYPMTLAETASIFAETVVRNYLIKNSKSKTELKSILWQEIQSAQGLLINIPARFEFEKRFATLRKEKSISVTETKELMIEAQKHWYGDSLSEYDEMFWASKLHFSMSGRSFYNYPYLFGYLFSLGIYSKKDEFGADFHTRYVNLLRDTGRMTAEELVKKHLGEDLTSKEFWNRSIKIIEDTFTEYKKLI